MKPSFHRITVELQPHELPPPPNPRERLADLLWRALEWTPGLAPEIDQAVRGLLAKLHGHEKRRAA